jgi:hypothetical protein
MKAKQSKKKRAKILEWAHGTTQWVYMAVFNLINYINWLEKSGLNCSP